MIRRRLSHGDHAGKFVTAFFVVIFALSSPYKAFAASEARDGYEPEVLAIIESIQDGRLERALNMATEHLTVFPKSRIGHLLKADILQAMSYQSPLVELNTGSQSETLDGLKHQIKNRWRHLKDTREISKRKVPASLIDLGRHEFVMVTDMQAGRLYLYRNIRERPVLVNDYYLTVGASGYGKEVQGDKKTPIGVYSIYKHIAPSELPDRYGKGAFPVNYPNRFDRSRERTGYGIWLHGTRSDTYARSPWASDGCFVLSNDDLVDIQQYIDIKNRTPVILSETIEWISVEELKSRRQEYFGVLDNWRRDWESLNTNAYLEHYERGNFNFGTRSFTAWSARKQQVNQAKTFVQVDLDIESLFLYPGEEDMFVVRYKQRYLSNNYSGLVNKEQYWKRNAQGQWKILYEG